MNKESLLRFVVDSKLIDQIKQAYPEVKGLTVTGVVDWALRFLLKQQEVGYMKRKAESLSELYFWEEQGFGDYKIEELIALQQMMMGDQRRKRRRS